MVALDQRHQPGGEHAVVLRAAEPPAGPELHELDAAIGAGQLGQLADQLADVGHDQALDHGVQRQIRRRFGQGQTRLSGTRRAQVELAPLTLDRARSGGPTPPSGNADTLMGPTT